MEKDNSGVEGAHKSEEAAERMGKYGVRKVKDCLLYTSTLNRLIKEIVVHERIDEDKTRHISIEIHFNLKPIPEVEQVTA